LNKKGENLGLNQQQIADALGAETKGSKDTIT
jgi:hypothetical protein